MICPTCHSGNPTTARSCGTCGAHLPAPGPRGHVSPRALLLLATGALVALCLLGAQISGLTGHTTTRTLPTDVPVALGVAAAAWPIETYTRTKGTL